VTRPARGRPLQADALGAVAEAARPPGVRVVLDARPLQEPDRAPLTATYLDGLLGAFDGRPLVGESFALLLRSDLDDPTSRFAHLDVIGRRMLPPTHLLRSAALTVDPFLLTGASAGAAWRAGRRGAAGAVYHAAGGAIPLATGLPLVVTLLDLAPWELAAAYQRSPAARFGQRLRARLLRDAAAVIVGTDAVAAAAHRLLRIRRDRLRVIPLAPRPAFRFWPGPASGIAPTDPAATAAGREIARRVDHRPERERLGLPERYLVYAGRFDARHDLATLLQALAVLAAAGRPAELPADAPWPPRVLLVGASPDDRASLARAAGRVGVGEALAYAPRLPDERLAALVRGARAVLVPALSDAAGLAALEAIACGTPVIASAVGALPEIVGGAGILVGPRDPQRLASALATAWADDEVHARIGTVARERAQTDRRTWFDVADDTRRVYAEVATGRPVPAADAGVHGPVLSGTGPGDRAA
jgi:glycosyltransferase involved in cell wall biosynthesis